MSYTITRRVWALRGIPPSNRLVLLALADFARDDAECFPHISTIMEKTEQSRPTIFRALKWLEDNGHISRKSREEEGKGSIYTIHAPALENEGARDGEHHPSQIETPPSQIETPPSQIETPPVSTRDPSQDAPIVKDLTNNLTVLSPPIYPPQPAEPPKKRQAAAQVPECLPDVEPSVYARWLAHRKAMGCKKPWTPEAQARHVRQAEKAGITNTEAFIYAIEAQWQAFTASYYFKAEAISRNVGGYKSAQEKRAESHRRWLFETPAQDENTIDVSATMHGEQILFLGQQQ